MIMWEISSGQPPFINYENDYEHAMKIINGMRPKIIPGTPLEYERLMQQCWDADPLNRPNIETVLDVIEGLKDSYYQNENNNQTFRCRADPGQHCQHQGRSALRGPEQHQRYAALHQLGHRRHRHPGRRGCRCGGGRGGGE